MQNGRIQEGAGLIDRERSSLPTSLICIRAPLELTHAKTSSLARALGGGVDCHGEEIRRRGGGGGGVGVGDGGDGAGITHSSYIMHNLRRADRRREGRRTRAAGGF